MGNDTDVELIEQAIEDFHRETTTDNLVIILALIRTLIIEGKDFFIPVDTPEDVIAMFDPEKINVGEKIQNDEDLHLKIMSVQDSDGFIWFPVYTSEEESDYGPGWSIINFSIEEILRYVLGIEETEGVVINPFGKAFTLTKDLIKIIFDM